MAGSYYLEDLTNTLERAACKYLDDIDKLGGTLAAIDAQYQQQEIQDAAYRWQREVDSGERIIVGVNKFTTETAERPDILRVDPALQVQQRERLQALRGERDNEAVATALERLRNAARTDDNLMAPIIEAVETLCTLGEISDALREVFGTYNEGGRD
jgi:methylmalonyl-CoA mutase N-terminal domain/subunit